MTNEALAQRAMAGDRQALYDLWLAVRRLALWLARRYVPLALRRGCTMEDIEQECFLAVWAAVRAFEPAGGVLFTSYLGYPIQSALRAALGLHTGKTIPDAPLSLNETAGEAGEGERQAAIPDETAAQAFADAEHRLYLRQLRQDLNRCLSALPKAQAAAIRAHYLRGKTIAQTAAQLGVTPGCAAQLIRQGLRQLRRAPRLSGYQEQTALASYYRGTGLAAWKQGGSKQEHTI